MKRFLLAVVFLTLSAAAFGQAGVPGTLVQHSPTHQDTCTPVNAQAASGSQTTLTIPAGPSQTPFIYITEIDIQMSVATALSAAVATTSVTVKQNGVTYLQYPITLPVTANTNYFFGPWQFGTTMKFPQSGQPVVITGITATTNLTQNINVCYYYAN